MGRGTLGETGVHVQRHTGRRSAAAQPERSTACGSSSVPASSAAAPTLASAPAPAPALPCRHLERVRELWGCARELGYRLKLNTVVTAANLHDDAMGALVAELRPERWKVFQVGRQWASGMAGRVLHQWQHYNTVHVD